MNRRLLATAIVLAALPAAPAMAAFPGENGRIAVQKNRNISTVKPDGSGRRQLTHSVDSFALAPDFAPSGERIAFYRGSGPPAGVWVMRANGRHKRRLTRSGGDPAFSPSGRRIVFTDEGIVLMRADGTHKRRFPGTSNATAPSFSPNGRRIVFAGFNKIMSVRTDGTNRRVLARHRDAAGPDYSPDGDRIIFSADSKHGRGDILVMNADGTNESTLLSTPLEDRDPVFSPNGAKIAFHRRHRGLFKMNADGSNVRQLSEARDFTPDWGPRP